MSGVVPHSLASRMCTAASSSEIVNGLRTKALNRYHGSRFSFTTSVASSLAEVTITGNAMSATRIRRTKAKPEALGMMSSVTSKS